MESETLARARLLVQECRANEERTWTAYKRAQLNTHIRGAAYSQQLRGPLDEWHEAHRELNAAERAFAQAAVTDHSGLQETGH